MLSKEELLACTYASACEAMYALEQFLQDIDSSWEDEGIGNYQHLKVIGNRIYE